MLYIVTYDYNCNGRKFNTNTIINSNNCSKEEINYLSSIGVIKQYHKPTVALVKDKEEPKIKEEIKEEIKVKKNTKSKKKVK